MQGRVIELFAGIGLVRLGLGDDYNVVFANDYDAKKRTMYAAAFSEAEDEVSLSEWDGRSIHEVGGLELPVADVWTASFPCNDLSIAGAWRGIKKGPESSAFFAVTRLLREREAEGSALPPVLLFENVYGFLLRDNGGDLLHALQDLNDLGYTVDVFMLDAAWWTTQSRRRLFIVGMLREAMPQDWAMTPTRIRPAA